MRFGAVGGAVTLFFMALNAFLGRVCGFSPQLAFLTAYPPALCLHFTLNKLWTFRDGRTTSSRHLAEYVFSTVVTFLIQWPCFLLLQGVLKLPGWMAAGGANILQMAVSYAFLRWRVFNLAADEEGEGGASAWHRLALLVTVLAASALIAWTALGEWVPGPLGGPQNDYYNLLVSGFRKGSLALDVPVPEALIKAKNPWDPAERPAGTALHDVSYYNGHFFLYFGVVPAVILFWPFRAIMGYALPFGFALPLFLILANLVSTLLWLRILRDRFPRSGLGTKVAGSLLLGLAAGQLVLARRNSFWEMPIGAGHLFLVCMLASSYAALRSRRPWAWLAAAGLSLGLAVGCRPTLAVAGPGLAVLVVALALDGQGLGARLGRGIKACLAAGLPLAAVIAALMAYNYARFGNPTEFGLNYQLNTNYEAKAHHFKLAFLPFNFSEYFTLSPQWGRYFPFLHPGNSVLPPAGYYGTEYVYGALVVCPVLWFALGAAAYLGRRGGPRATPFAGVVLAVALATSFVLCCFNTAAARYVTDFLPWWMWLAMLGWALLEERSAAAGAAGRVARWAFGACAVATALMAFLQSCAVHGVLKFVDPRAYRSIARTCDTPVAWWERLRGENLGPVAMDVRFAEQNTGSLEPLLVSGVGYEAAYYFVFYKTNRTVQLGYEGAGDAMLVSDDIAVDAKAVHHIVLSGGSLLPPAAHPVYAGWSRGEVSSLTNWVQIDFDGRPVLDQERQASDGAPEFVQVGRDARSGAFGRRFSGTITNVHRERLARPAHTPELKGDIELEVLLPRGVVPGAQPLVVVGRPGSAELVGYLTVDPDHFELTYEYWGGGFWTSPPIAVPPDRHALFRIRLDSLNTPRSGSRFAAVRGQVIVWMNGLPVWWRPSAGPLEADPPVDILANTVGSSAMRSSFQGRLLSWRRDPPPSWPPGPFRSVELDLLGRGRQAEPVVATGPTGRADTLALEWLSGNRAKLVYDHWGIPVHVSAAFDWDESRMHHMRIAMPSFLALDRGGASEGMGPLVVEVDGKRVWEAPVPYYVVGSDSVVFGRNAAGSSATTASLSCSVWDILQSR